jgi:hypothetical protein
MRARARAARASAPAVPGTSAGRHAKAGDSPMDEDFDYSQPFEVDLGRAAVIAEGLRESGYPRCTADVVTEELAKPERERSIIGRFSADQLKRAGWRP